ncbi:MAG: chorismate synthase [Myxococcota bacterium]
MLRRLRMSTAGESHGEALLGILEGIPAGLRLDEARVQEQLDRRRRGYGRSVRMQKETDVPRFLCGVRDGVTLGAPIGVILENADHKPRAPFSVPRPGHADLAGMSKLGSDDGRPVLERSSARETAMRVALASVCRELLRTFDVEVGGHVLALGGECSPLLEEEAGIALAQFPSAELLARSADAAPVGCLDNAASVRMSAAIDAARGDGDTLGGVVEVVVTGCPAGLGSYAQWDERLSGRLAGAVLSVPAIKGVEVGIGFRAAGLRGSRCHDLIVPGPNRRPVRPTNRAGGLEGGVTNGEPVVVRAAMKPLPTLMRPLPTVDMRTGDAAPALLERSDVCAVPAARVVIEAMICLVIADALLEKLGGDSLDEVRRHFQASFSGEA